jgi:hypothetical protein
MSDVSQGQGWYQASDLKWYPPESRPAPPTYSQEPERKRRGRGCLYGLLGAVALVVVIIIAAVASSGGGSSSKATGGIANLGGKAPAAAYKVGDTAKTGGFNATVYAAKDPQPPADSFNTPKPGNHFVSVDMQITNPGTSQQSFSSLIGIHLLDSLNHQYDEDIEGAGLSPNAPDGELAAGQSVRGFVVFQVPDGTSGLKLRVQGGLTSAGAVFTLS